MSVNMALHVAAITTSIEGDMLWLAMEQEQFSLLILTIHHAHNKD